ncbi:MAG TPA: tetratricopeptide repeat protein, partial [Vicinamibacteria bacterium]|nr:tetratricopeptide repeat protein [Vicinamibacteria bacterium]
MLALLLALLGAAPPQDGSPLLEQLGRAQRLLEAEDRAGARRELDQALRLHPESPLVRNFLGVLEAQEGHYAAAESRFREALARAPQYTDAALNLGRLYLENAAQDPGALGKALVVYTGVLQYQPDHVDARYQSAFILHAQGEFGRSLEQLDRLPAADQQRPTALALRCGDEAGRGDRAKADAAADRLLDRRDLTEDDLRPILPDLVGHGREDLAVRFLERLEGQGLASPAALRQLGLLYEGQKQLDRARATLERAAEKETRSVDLLVALARVAQKQQDYRGALGYLAHARSLEPANAGVHFFFGMVCIDLELGVEAFDSLKEAVRLEPESAPFNYALGAVALHRRDPGEAIPYFKKYAELRPADARGPFAIGAAAFQAHDFPLAHTELEKAAAHAETAAGAHYFLARIAREEGDLDEALRLAQKAVTADPRYADPYAELGILYLRKRETDKAEASLRQCLELDPDNYLGNYHLLML